MRLHLQHGRTAELEKEDVARTVESRISYLERLIQAKRGAFPAPAPAAAPAAVDPVFQQDDWAAFLRTTQPPGIASVTPPATSTSIPAMPTSSYGVIPGFNQK